MRRVKTEKAWKAKVAEAKRREERRKHGPNWTRYQGPLSKEQKKRD